MDLHAFSRANRIRCESALGFQHYIDNWTGAEWLTATMSPLGAVAEILKVQTCRRDALESGRKSIGALNAELEKKLADTFIYLDLLTQVCGFETAEIVWKRFEQKSKTMGYPESPSIRGGYYE